jgi:hypothetical protein
VRLYSDKITEADLCRAFRLARLENGADIWPEDVRTFRPRRAGFRNGLHFYAYSHCGNRPTGHRMIGSYPLDDVARAASWDAYGYVIARLFMIDRQAHIGQYCGVADFRRQVRQSRRREPKDFLCLLS